MNSIPKQNPFQGTLLKIGNLEGLSDIFRILDSDFSLAKQITAIEIDEKEVRELELDAEGDPPSTPPEVFENYGIETSKIIEKVQECSGLGTFKWTGVAEKNTRPAVFWESLWKSASTLKTLDIEFSTHELDKLSKLTLPSATFPVLEALRIDAAAAHGDNGSLVDELLKGCLSVRQLKLDFPTCDLERCRIQGITWQYTFPSLQNLALRTYNSDNAALSSFLLRHRRITTLEWDVDSDYGFLFPTNSLPELGALSLTVYGNIDKGRNLETLAKCEELKHLQTHGYWHTSYLHIAKLSEKLKCLEFDPGTQIWRKGFEELHEDEEDEEIAAKLEAETGFRTLSGIVGGLLRELKVLEELAVDLETGNTVSSNDEGKFVHPNPMDVEDLKSMIMLLPRDTKIRALRMSDERGLDLPDEILENFPNVPTSLEYLNWITREKRVLYRLERHGGGIKAVQGEPLRASSAGESWVEGRVLSRIIDTKIETC